MKRPALLLLIVGLFAALAAGGLVYFVSSSAVAKTAPPPPPTPVPTATAVPMELVVLAAQDIPIRHLVTAADVVTRAYPLGVAPEDSFHTVTEVMSRTATTQVFKGQMLLARQFIDAGGATGASTTIPPGKMLVAFPATDMLNATGAVHAGDHVDIMISIPVSGTAALNSSAGATQEGAGTEAKTVVTQATMQNIEVYSTGTWTPTGPAADQNSGEVKIITFIVDHQEALILKYVKDSGGTIDLGVRSIADTQDVTTDPVSLDYLVDLYHLIQVPSR
jgi:pilus assembly protein CpaB